jgi:glycosyltransferase involved in cell wall biosynthesis
MRVFFDSTPLQDRRGIGRWAQGTFDALREICDVVQTIPANYDTHRVSLQDTERNAVFLRDMLPGDVAFFPSVHWAPIPMPPRSVVGILDVIPLLYPDNFHPVWVEPWRTRYRSVAREADSIVTLSDSAAEDIATHLGIPRAKIHVVPMGVELLPSWRGITPPEPPYVFTVGTDWHKNLPVLYEAARRLSGVRVYIVGAKVHGGADVPADLEGRIIPLGRVNDETIGTLLLGASAFVWPSVYEGLGLPPLEALRYGVPVISSDRPAMNETLAGFARLLPHDDAAAWRDAILEAVEQPVEMRAMAVRGKQEVETRYTWANCSEALWCILREASRAVEIPAMPTRKARRFAPPRLFVR